MTTRPSPEAEADGPGAPEDSAQEGLPAWVPLTLVTLVPLAILLNKLHGVSDPDAFWHILSGRLTWETHSVAGPDPFGHFSTREWVRLDWLSDLAMNAAYAVAGYAGVAWLYAVAGVGVFVALYLAARARGGLLAGTLAASIGWVGTAASLQFRPQTFSFVLLAVVAAAWYRSSVDLRPRWWVVPVVWVWSCLHGLWFLGPMVGGIVVVGLLLDRRLDRRTGSRLGLVVVLSAAVAALTPVGPRLFVLPFTVNSYAGLVSEYEPPDIRDPYVAATVVLVVVVAVGWALRSRRVASADLLTWLAALGFALLYGRTVAVAAVLLTPLAAEQVQAALRRAAEPRGGRAERTAVGVMVALTLVLATVLTPVRAATAEGMPSGLSPALDALPAETVVLDDDGTGGWLLLEHPDLRPVVDTRTYLFSVEYLTQYKTARLAQGDWRGFVDRTGATSALLRAGEPLTTALVDELGWRQVAADGPYVLLTAG